MYPRADTPPLTSHLLPVVPPPLYVYTLLLLRICFLRSSLFANTCRCFPPLPSLSLSAFSIFATRSAAAAGLYCLLELSPSLSYIDTTGNAMTFPFLLTIRPGFAGLDKEACRAFVNQTRRKKILRDRWPCWCIDLHRCPELWCNVDTLRRAIRANARGQTAARFVGKRLGCEGETETLRARSCRRPASYLLHRYISTVPVYYLVPCSHQCLSAHLLEGYSPII